MIFNDNGTADGAGIYYDKTTGNVGIGMANPTNALAVNGTIKAKGISVTLDGWADYVFAPGYVLMPIAEVERYIERNGHLPDMPSTHEAMQGDVDLGSMQVQMLRKIEELTLYMIELKQENDALRQRMDIPAGREMPHED